MNDARREGRYGVLVEAFYRLKSLHVGASEPLKPGQFDERDLRKFMAREEATFVEVKNAMRFVFVQDQSKYWATNLTDLAGFARAYPKICLQLDGWFDLGPSSTAVAATAVPGERRIPTEEQVAAQREGFYRATGESPSDDARAMWHKPDQFVEVDLRGPDAARDALRKSGATE